MGYHNPSGPPKGIAPGGGIAAKVTTIAVGCDTRTSTALQTRVSTFRCANIQPFLCIELGPFQAIFRQFQSLFRSFEAISGNSRQFKAISGHVKRFWGGLKNTPLTGLTLNSSNKKRLKIAHLVYWKFGEGLESWGYRAFRSVAWDSGDYRFVAAHTTWMDSWHRNPQKRRIFPGHHV